ncbi:hypothetical protein [Methylobacterium oxalidis]|nr:hypothetical protein [Methylobacterium oxalidis]
MDADAVPDKVEVLTEALRLLIDALMQDRGGLRMTSMRVGPAFR